MVSCNRLAFCYARISERRYSLDVYRQEYNDTLNIGNLIQKRSFEVKTPETRIITDPANALRIRTKKIDGVTYILVPAGESVTVNGVEVTVKTGD